MGGESDTVTADSHGVEIVLPKEKQGKVKKTVRLDSFLFAPVEDGATLGAVEYRLDGKIIRRSSIKAQNGVEYARSSKSLFEIIKEKIFNG